MKIVPMGLFAVLLLAGPTARAAPTCVDRQGATMRCGTLGAMPVGWTLPPGEQGTAPAGAPSAGGMIGLSLFLGGLLALMALLPDFEGRWDSQETDEEEQG